MARCVLRPRHQHPFGGQLSVLKRIGLFLLTNFAIMITLTVIWELLVASGVIRNLRAFGGYGPLMVMSALFGFGGAFISLLMSKWIAKRMTGAQVIESPRNAYETLLFETVRRHADRAGIAMPEIAIYDSPEMNAFATGPSRNRALVADGRNTHTRAPVIVGYRFHRSLHGRCYEKKCQPPNECIRAPSLHVARVGTTAPRSAVCAGALGNARPLLDDESF